MNMFTNLLVVLVYGYLDGIASVTASVKCNKVYGIL
jgi:hypothetical protein